MTQTNSIKLPNAAIIIWNYKERLDDENSNVANIDEVYEKIVCTSSCVSIQTSKSKSNPVGSFQIELAPTRNWVSNITAGSWCVILMSSEKITKNDLKSANPKNLKMIGKIETVRVDTQQVDDMRKTRYFISGVDWGYLFNNYIHIDPLGDFENPNNKVLSAGALRIENMLFGSKNNRQDINSVSQILRQLINIFTGELKTEEDVSKIRRFAKSVYTVKLPEDMKAYLKMSDADISASLKLKTGTLKQQEDTYEELDESWGFIDYNSLVGTNTLWQILMDNSSPAINELYSDLRWNNSVPEFTIYNRIKPFSLSKSNSYIPSPAKTQNYTDRIRSLFTLVKKHDLISSDVIQINTGTNWRDKYNYIQIRPNHPDFNVVGTLTLEKTLIYDNVAWGREGFRPLIIETKQAPRAGANQIHDFDLLDAWTNLLREWFFDTHRLLNGTITMVGVSEYIAVGNNIRFDLALISSDNNMTNATANKNIDNFSVLAHVENVNHSFTVDDFGARRYITQIQFVRGVIVNKKTNQPVDGGKLDEDISKNKSAKNSKKSVNSSNSGLGDQDSSND